MEQGWVHSTSVMDGWAEAVMKWSQKRYMVSGTQCPYVGVCGDKTLKGETLKAEGPTTYDFTWGNFLQFLFSICLKMSPI